MNTDFDPNLFTSIPRKGRRPPPEGETARGRFLRIGKKRMDKAIDTIRLLGNFARGDYEWTPEDIKHMRTALEREINRVLDEFEQGSSPRKKRPDFKFPDGRKPK